MRPCTIRPIIPVIFAWLLAGITPLAWPGTAGAESRTLLFPVDHPDHYLLQAFQAGNTDDRQAIRHIGVVTEPLEEHWVVSATLQGYPAHAAGLRRGDHLLRLDGDNFHPLRSFNPETTDCGRPGRPHRLEYSRNGEPRSVDIEAVCENLFDSYRSATEHSLNTFIVGNKAVSYVQLWALSRNPDDLQYFHQLLDRIGNSDALILDLRHAHGYFDWAYVHPFFAGRSRYATIQVENPSRQRVASPLADARPEDLPRFEKPLVLIANEQTRGGAELLLYQLNRSTRSLSTGRTTAGFIEGIPLQLAADGLLYRSLGAIEIDGQRPEMEGIGVDFEQDYPLDQSRSTDPQFESALNLLLNVL